MLTRAGLINFDLKKYIMKLIVFVAVVVICVEQSYSALTNDPDWWKKAVFYQIYPRSFKDSDDDGVGDLRGIIEKLPHLKNAGIGGTWLSPIFKSPMVDFGYDIADYYTVDPTFGTNKDLADLIEAAHELDIKVIMDFVPNHTSDQSDWFILSENRTAGYEDYYVWVDGIADPNNATAQPEVPNNWRSIMSGPMWTWSDIRKQYYLHQFTPQQPDLNYRSSKVVQEMKDVITYWMDQGIDGFRIDAIVSLFEVSDFSLDEPLVQAGVDDGRSHTYLKHIYTMNLNETYDMARLWRQLIDDYNKNHANRAPRIIMTEGEFTKRFYGTVDNPIAHIPFNFAFMFNVTNTSASAEFEKVAINSLAITPDWAVCNWVLGNHDQPRVASRHGPERVDAMNFLSMTLPGAAITYNGEEIGMEDYRGITWEETQDPQACQTGDKEHFQTFSRDPVRTPFQWDDTAYAGFSNVSTWLPVHPNYKTLNLKAQTNALRSHFKVYQALTKLRQEPAFRDGEFRSTSTGSVLAYLRWLSGGKTYGVAINFGTDVVHLNLTGLGIDPAKVLIGMTVLSVDSEKTVGEYLDPMNITVTAHEAFVFEVKSSSAASIGISVFLLGGFIIFNIFRS